MTKHYRWLTLGVLFALSGCTLPDAQAGSNGQAVATSALEQARERWQQQDLKSYRYSVRQLCFCPEPMRSPVEVEVTNANVTAARLPDGTAVPESMRHLSKTVPQWFDYLETAQGRGWHKVELSFDERLGYPQHIDIDKDERMADEEVEFVIELAPR